MKITFDYRIELIFFQQHIGRSTEMFPIDYLRIQGKKYYKKDLNLSILQWGYQEFLDL